MWYLDFCCPDEQDRSVALEGDNIAPGTGIDLEIESESTVDHYPYFGACLGLHFLYGHIFT